MLFKIHNSPRRTNHAKAAGGYLAKLVYFDHLGLIADAPPTTKNRPSLLEGPLSTFSSHKRPIVSVTVDGVVAASQRQTGHSRL